MTFRARLHRGKTSLAGRDIPPMAVQPAAEHNDDEGTKAMGPARERRRSLARRRRARPTRRRRRRAADRQEEVLGELYATAQCRRFNSCSDCECAKTLVRSSCFQSPTRPCFTVRHGMLLYTHDLLLRLTMRKEPSSVPWEVCRRGSYSRFETVAQMCLQG